MAYITAATGPRIPPTQSCRSGGVLACSQLSHFEVHRQRSVDFVVHRPDVILDSGNHLTAYVLFQTQVGQGGWLCEHGPERRRLQIRWYLALSQPEVELTVPPHQALMYTGELLQID